MRYLTNVAKRLVPLIVDFPLNRYLERPSMAIRWLGYSLYYLYWYARNDIANKLLETEHPFGHHNRFVAYQHLVTEHCLDKVPINYLEFGVHKGASISWWVKMNRNPDSRFTGFDCFQGLPEAWANVPEGHFSTDGEAPSIDDERCHFVEGLFQNTLPNRNLTNPNTKKNIIHLDADLYSSSLFVLLTLNDILQSGDILIFDEFAYPTDEFRAFLDWQASTNAKTSAVCAVNCGDIMALEID